MLTKRVIPCLDVDLPVGEASGGRVVKGVSFLQLRDAGDPVRLAAYYDREGADELVFLDITASAEGRRTMVEVVERTAEEVFIPLTVGGGLRTLEDMHLMLQAGADKVSINTAAVLTPELVQQAARRFGSQCIVIAIDAKRVPGSEPLQWEVYTYGGRRPAGIEAVAWAQQVAVLGAGEILLTSMDADGHQSGYDVELTRAVAEGVPIPVIASGGAGTPQHLYDVLAHGKADAVLAASIFHYGTYTLRQVKDYLAQRGIPIRG